MNLPVQASMAFCFARPQAVGLAQISQSRARARAQLATLAHLGQRAAAAGTLSYRLSSGRCQGWTTRRKETGTLLLAGEAAVDVWSMH